jgi:hypothetical protein
MALLNKVIENKRDEYMINVLEEGTTELESLKTKKYLTENLHMIGKILMEEGVVDAAKANLANNWGKYAAGAGVVGAGVAADQLGLGDGVAGAIKQGYEGGVGAGFNTAMNGGSLDQSIDAAQGGIGGAMANGGTQLSSNFDGAVKTITDAAGNVYDEAGNLLKKAGDAISGAYDDASKAVQGAYSNASGAVQGAYTDAAGAVTPVIQDANQAIQSGVEAAKANVEANPAAYAAGAGALGGAALGAGGAYAANRATQRA